MRFRGPIFRRVHSFAARAAAGAVAVLSLFALFLPAAHGQFRDPNIEVEFDQFGVGNAYRPGDIVPMRLVLMNSPTGNLDEIVEAWVQWEVPNADGDIGEYGRRITLQRGQRVPTWLYAPVPPDARGDTVWPVRVFDFRDGQRRHEIGGRRLRPFDFNSPQSVPLNASMIGIIGPRQMGLQQFAAQRDERPISSHELTRIVPNIRPDRLPDRWEGLQGYEAIVWGQAAPQELTADTAAALREYVRRGGHLVIVLPEDANPWQFGGRAQTALDDLLPNREPRKDAAVALQDLLPIMSKSRSVDPERAPEWASGQRTIGVRVFKEIGGDFDVINPPYEPLIAMPDGRVIVIQRTFGHGRITISGLDVTYQTLYSIPLGNRVQDLHQGTVGLPQADILWNRILGRRMDTPTPSEMQAMDQQRLLLPTGGRSDREIGSGSLILQHISMDTAAGLGLMLALLLFGAYWALAGPGGFAMLKFYKRTHHAWIAFAAASGVFTVIAWGAVGLIRVNEPRIEHVTFLDHIARPGDDSRPTDAQFQRAVSWFSLYTPGYTDAHISIESDRVRRNILTSWTPPPPDGPPRFPNANRFRVNVADSPHSYAIPSRQTTTLLHANWLGGLDPKWGGMIRESVGSPVEVMIDGGGQERGLAGRLTHNFNGALSNVTVIWVRNLRLPTRQYQLIDGEERPWVPILQSGAMLNSGYIWRLGSPWEPGQALDLSGFEPRGTTILSTNLADRYYERYRRSPTVPTATALTREQRRDYLEMLSIFNQLTPPQYYKARAEDRHDDTVHFGRRLGREVDLSPWFTRPCIIVIGFLEDSEIPVPVSVNDARPTSRGVTVVRWVYPLPLNEDIAFRRPGEEDQLGE